MEKSNHKNYVEWYGRNWSTLINDIVIPHQKTIFNLFNNKFKLDAQKDWERWREKLKELWNACANNCELIQRIILHQNDKQSEYNDDILKVVTNIVNIDYWSLHDFFNALRSEYETNTEIYKILDEICNYVRKMREISRNHTNIISQ